MKYTHIVAIDPDVEKSGVAYLSASTRILEVSNLSFPELLDYLQHVKKESDANSFKTLIVVEAGYLIQSNWHLLSKDSKASAAAKGNSTGRNHETARKIVEMAKHYGLEVYEQVPLKKCWKGRDGKITHEEFSKITNVNGKTNQETRDAGLIAWCHAGFPIKI